MDNQSVPEPGSNSTQQPQRMQLKVKDMAAIGVYCGALLWAWRYAQENRPTNLQIRTLRSEKAQERRIAARALGNAVRAARSQPAAIPTSSGKLSAPSRKSKRTAKHRVHLPRRHGEGSDRCPSHEELITSKNFRRLLALHSCRRMRSRIFRDCWMAGWAAGQSARLWSSRGSSRRLKYCSRPSLRRW